MACSDFSRLANCLVDTILDDDRELDTDTLGIFDDSAVTENSLDLRLCCSFTVSTE
jgi:hypothetical protein